MGCGKTTIARLCLVLVCCSGFWLGLDLHLWLVAHDGEGGHDSHTCPICQQAHASPKAVLVTASVQPITPEPMERALVLPADVPAVTRSDDPISLRGPPLGLGLLIF